MKSVQSTESYHSHSDEQEGCPCQYRVSLLKPINQIQDMDDESEDIYQTSSIDMLLDPISLITCLVEFAAKYTTRSGQ